MAHFRDQATCHRYMKAEGWVIGDATCLSCGNSWEAAVEPGTRTDRLECPECGMRMSIWFEREDGQEDQSC